MSSVFVVIYVPGMFPVFPINRDTLVLRCVCPLFVTLGFARLPRVHDLMPTKDHIDFAVIDIIKDGYWPSPQKDTGRSSGSCDSVLCRLQTAKELLTSPLRTHVAHLLKSAFRPAPRFDLHKLAQLDFDFDQFFDRRFAEASATDTGII